MEERQKETKDEKEKEEKEQEALIIATADTQLVSEITASTMDAEESLDLLLQDDSVREPSFNEGNFMSHNLLTSASTPICPASAVKRLLHLSNDSSEDNRTPPKKLRTEMIPKLAVVDANQDSDGGSDSWKSHDENRLMNHPSDAHQKGGSFILDTGAADADADSHHKNDSFCQEHNGAGATSSYDSHQGHIYRTGMSSDRLLDMRTSPTKQQLVRMVENLNRKIAKYENNYPCYNKNELLENSGKKLTFVMNAVCVVEMKDENCAHIRSIAMCEEPHLMPANTYCSNEPPYPGCMGGHHNGSSDADRSSSLTNGSSQASGPGPFEVPQLTHLARMTHDSLTSSTTTSSSAGGRNNQGLTADNHRHIKLSSDKLTALSDKFAHHMRMACPRCDYTFSRHLPPTNHSRSSSSTASPLVELQEKAHQFRDTFNLDTPPMDLKAKKRTVSVGSEARKSTITSGNEAKKSTMLDRDTTAAKESTISTENEAKKSTITSGNEAPDCKKRTISVGESTAAKESTISTENEAKKITITSGNEAPDCKKRTISVGKSTAAKESTISTGNEAKITNKSPITAGNEGTDCKMSTMTVRDSMAAKESTITTGNVAAGSNKSPITAGNEALDCKMSTMLDREITAAKESTISTENEATAVKNSTLKSSKPRNVEESTITSGNGATLAATSNAAKVFEESSSTIENEPSEDKKPVVAKESTGNEPNFVKSSTMTARETAAAKESTISLKRPTSTGEYTSGEPPAAKRRTSDEYSTIAAANEGILAKNSTMFPSKPKSVKESKKTSEDELLLAKNSTMLSSKPLCVKESTKTSEDEPLSAKNSTMLSSKPLCVKESTKTSEDEHLSAKNSTMLSSKPLCVKESTKTSEDDHLSAKNSTMLSSKPVCVKESTRTSEDEPLLAKNSTMLSSKPLCVKESTKTSEDEPSSAKNSTSKLTTVKEVSKQSTLSLGVTRESRMIASQPTTSSGHKGTGIPFLCLDTSSMSTDSDAENFYFPPILDDPSIRSQFLDVEAVGGEAEFDDVTKGCKALMGDEKMTNKSKTELSPNRQFLAQMELIKKGPIPESGSDLFKGCSVVFSRCLRHIDVWRTLRSTDTEGDSDREYRAPSEDHSPMDVQRLTRQVLAGGGQVFSRLHQVPGDMRHTLYLVTDRPSRSARYLSCVLDGVPVVSYMAVISACIDKQHFGRMVQQNCDFWLPVGWSDETGHSILRHPEKRQPLLGKRVLYTCGNHVTHRFWREILARMGAHVVSLAGNHHEVDIVVSSDAHAQSNYHVPVVNCNWIVHTLLHGSCRRHDASPFYSPDYCDGGGDSSC
ncbi:uncharacterized protein LOC111061941 isoform X2 [Nilaparvata lugens]|uniref:uncharacterized protein LOC111061941 isoform X2 n=1 Tax=Nilaparvata lugens TaxID=108931 RepID=UPI00193D104B|nr:uncharacterized protein LOC111061941 isoform X2 [Nilaparvata lugens]